MDRDEAQERMQVAQEINFLLNNAAELANSIADEDLQKQMKWALGQAMGKIYLDLMRPVVKQFPELDPDLPNENS